VDDNENAWRALKVVRYRTESYCNRWHCEWAVVSFPAN